MNMTPPGDDLRHYLVSRGGDIVGCGRRENVREGHQENKEKGSQLFHQFLRKTTDQIWGQEKCYRT